MDTAVGKKNVKVTLTKTVSEEWQNWNPDLGEGAGEEVMEQERHL